VPTDTDPVACVQTHASVVLLAKEQVYKLKKPKFFGFFDYRTPQQRRHFCLEELRLNARLAPRIYLGVAPVLTAPGKQAVFGPALSPEQLPEPGDHFGSRTVSDFAVVMERLPDEATLEERLRRHDLDPALLPAIARRVADFHRSIPTNNHISSYGELETIKGNWEENFEQMRPYVGRALDERTFDCIFSYIHDFMHQRERLFAARIRDGRIRDCHGDLRLQHIYCIDSQSRGYSSPRNSGVAKFTIDIIDCIEFNERFRYGDVAGEVAFLTMELDEAGRPDLAHEFTDSYMAASGDEALAELLPFYSCYRACVRGKVLAFQLDEPEVPAVQKEAACRRSNALFHLAARYAGGPTTPLLVMIGGVMGTGKSTLAAGLSHELGFRVIASDVTRKRLAGTAQSEPHADAYGAGLYTASWTKQTYRALLAEATAVLADARSIILDASFSKRADRRAATALAVGAGARPILVECRCPRAIALHRLALRWQARTQAQEPAEPTAPASLSVGASDGRPELYDAQAATWQPVLTGREVPLQHLEITTSGSPQEALQELLQALAPLGSLPASRAEQD
jgi:aminoglycoside phosphotransferase family enzyme/predicted kinase